MQHPHVEIARSLGADRVVDDTREDVTKDEMRYDLHVDIAGTRALTEMRRVLQPDATVVIVGGPRSRRPLGPLGHVIRSRIAALRASQRVTFFVAKPGKEDMETLRELLATGALTSVIDSVYPLDEVGAALRHMGDRHPRGTVLIAL